MEPTLVTGGDQAGRRRRDLTTIVSRSPAASPASQDAAAAYRALCARAEGRDLGRHDEVDLQLVARQLRWHAARGSGAARSHSERVLLLLVERAMQNAGPRAGSARDALAHYLGNPTLFDVGRTVKSLIEEGRGIPGGEDDAAPAAASPGSASHNPADLAARRTKWVAAMPRVAKTLRFNDLIRLDAGGADGPVGEMLYDVLPLTLNHAAAALAPDRGAPRSAKARAEAWRKKVREVYVGHVNGRIEFPREQARSFGWAVALREEIPRNAEAEAQARRRRRARPGKDFDDLLNDVVEGRGGGGGGGGGGGLRRTLLLDDDEDDEGGGEDLATSEVSRMQAVLGGLRALQHIIKNLGDDGERLPVLRAATDNVAKLAEKAVVAASGDGRDAARADYVSEARDNIVWGAVQQAAYDGAGPARKAEVRRAAADMADAAGGMPRPREAWRLLDVGR